MGEFGTLNFSVGFKKTSAFPLDVDSYFTSLEKAQQAASTAVEPGSADSVYYIGQTLTVVEGENSRQYIIQPDKTLKSVISEDVYINNTPPTDGDYKLFVDTDEEDTGSVEIYTKLESDSKFAQKVDLDKVSFIKNLDEEAPQPETVAADTATKTLQDWNGNNIVDTYATKADLNNKQDILVSGTSIKTINSQELLGQGNITFKEGIDPDEEDITNTNNKLKLADRSYDPSQFSGRGYKILRKNIVDGKNILTQDMINEENTIYEIKYDFDLDEQTIEVKSGCTVIFTYGGNCKNGTLWLHGRDISVFGGRCEASIKVGLTNEEITQAYSNWFNSNYNITIRDVNLVNPITNAISYMTSLGDNYDMSTAKCGIELENIIGVNIINCEIQDYEVGIKYSQKGTFRQSVSRINILNNVIKHSYCCIYNKEINEDTQDYGDTTISNNEFYAVKNCINIQSQDGVIISNNTMYCIVNDATKTNNSVIKLSKVLNINILGNQIFGGQYGILLEGKCNYTNISANIFANTGKLLSKSGIENSNIIHVENYTGALNITGNTLAPQYTNHYIHLKDSKFADLVIVGNAFKANAEDLGKSVGYSELFSVYNPYYAENIEISNISKIQDVISKLNNTENINCNRDIIYNIAYNFKGVETVNINGHNYIYPTIYEEDYLVGIDYYKLMDRKPLSSGTKIMYVLVNNIVTEISISSEDTYKTKFNKIKEQLTLLGLPVYNDTTNGILYVLSKGGIRFINNVAENTRETISSVMGANIIDYNKTPLYPTLLNTTTNLRSIDSGFINYDRYIATGVVNEVSSERSVKLSLTEKSGVGVAIIPYVANLIIRKANTQLTTLKALYDNGLLKFGIVVEDNNVLVIPKEYNSGIIFQYNNLFNYTVTQTPLDYSTVVAKYLTNIFAYDKLDTHSTQLSSVNIPSGQYRFVYDKKKPAWKYGENWYYSNGLDISILVKGTTEQRPTLTSTDDGFEYYDSTLKKKILWNGTEWTNLDGTALT